MKNPSPTFRAEENSECKIQNSKSFSFRIFFAAAFAFLAATLAAPSAFAAVKTWDGGGADSNWLTVANWDADTAPVANDSLIFAGSTRVTPVNNFTANTQFNGISFISGVSNWSLSGNGINLGGNITNSSAVNPTVANNLALLQNTVVDTGTVGNATNGGTTLSGIISGAGFSLNKIGSGRLVLGGANTFSGGLRVNEGTVNLSVVGGAGNGTITLGSAGGSENVLMVVSTGTVTNAWSIAAGTGTRTITNGTGNVVLNGGFAVNNDLILDTITSGTSSLTVGGVITGSGNITIQNSGNATNSTTLDNNNAATYNGRIQVNSGATAVVGATSMNYGNSTIDLKGTGALRITQAGTIGGLVGDSTSQVVAPAGTSKLLTLSGSGDYTFNGAIVGNGTATPSITKTGTGTQTLTGNSTYPGATTVNAGTLNLTGGLSGSNITVNGASANFTESSSGVIAGTGTTFTLSNGNVTLAGANTFTGGTSIGAGTLTITNSNAIGTGNLTFTAGTLQVVTNDVTLGNLVAVGAGATIAGTQNLSFTANLTGIAGGSKVLTNNIAAGKTLTLGNVTINPDAAQRSLTIAGTGNTTIGGVISSGGNSTNTFTVTSSGTTILSGVNTYTGQTTLGVVSGATAGTLQLVGTGTISNAAANIYSGNLDINGTSQTIGALNLGNGAAGTAANILIGSGNLTLGGGVTYSGTIDNGATISGAGKLNLLGDRTFSVTDSTAAANDLTVSAVIANGDATARALTKTGAGNLLLSGSNTYTGNTTITLGTLTLGNKSALGTGAAYLATSLQASTDLSASNAIANDVFVTNAAATIMGSNNITVNGNFTLLTAASNMIFTSNITGGTLVLAGNVYLSANASAKTLVLSGPGNTTISGGIANSANGTAAASSLTFSNTGTTTLSGVNTYNGTTILNSGTVRISGINGANTGNGNYTLNGGLLSLDNTAGNNNNRIADTSKITLVGGSFLYKGSDITNSSESVGTIVSGLGVVTLTYGGANTATLTAASFTHASGESTTLVNGTSLGKDSASSSASRFIITAAPTLTGTTNATSTGINSSVKNTKVVPFLVGEAAVGTGGLGTVTGTANTFLTYNATTGLRPLNLTDEFTKDAITAGNNTYVTTATSALATAAINSLVINGGDLTIASGQTLTNTSGALLFASSSAVGGAGNYTGTSENQISVNSGFTGAISVPVTGSSALTKSGAGTLVLSGTNTYSGTTSVKGGTLILTGSNNSAGATTLDTGVTLILGGTSNGGLASGLLTLVNNSAVQAQTQAATLTNNLSIGNPSNAYNTIFSGSQNIAITGNVTFTQGTSSTLVNSIAGTLTLGKAGSNIYLATPATGQPRTIAGTGNTILAGNIINSSTANASASSLTITNTGVTTLSGTNTYNGTTTVSAGILTFLNTNAKSSSAVTAGAAGSIGLGVATSGSFYTSADVDSLFANTLTGFTMNAASGVAIDTSAGNFTYATNQSAARALTKLGSNTLTLTGANTYTGATTVAAGTLLVSGSTASGSAVTVTGGTGTVLGGAGTINGPIGFTTATGGILAAGGSNAVGTLIAGPVSASLTSTIQMELSSASSYDILRAASVTATNFDLNVVALTGMAFANGDSFKIFQTQAGGTLALTGTFGVVNLPDLSSSPGLTWDATKLYTDGTLNVVPEPATWALLAFSLTIVMVLRRRRRS